MKNKEQISAALLVLNAIDAWEKKYPPSYRELCDMAGISSTSTLKYCADKLAALGYIERDPAKARSITRTTKPIDEKDFTQKGKADDSTSASIRQANEKPKARGKLEHERPATLPLGDAGTMDGRRKHRREHGKDTPSRQRKTIRLPEQ